MHGAFRKLSWDININSLRCINALDSKYYRSVYALLSCYWLSQYETKTNADVRLHFSITRSFTIELWLHCLISHRSFSFIPCTRSWRRCSIASKSPFHCTTAKTKRCSSARLIQVIIYYLSLQSVVRGSSPSLRTVPQTSPWIGVPLRALLPCTIPTESQPLETLGLDDCFF